jgi:putative cell wall-binding protein
MARWTRSALVILSAMAMVLALGLPALADHTAPNSPLTLNPSANAIPGGEPSIVRSPQGDWEHKWWFPGHEASDITFFRKGGNLYASQGTLGQGPQRSVYVGQRIVQLMEGDEMLDPPRIRADHGSAACEEEPIPPATSATGLQHDSFATPPGDPEILTDTTDATGRCHDTGGGGIELIDISGLDNPEFEPRELHLLRFNAYSHTTTLDPERPWIIYSNNSSANGTNFLDFADIRSCLTESNGGFIPDSVTDLEEKRELCRPEVYRIPFEDEWTQQTVDGEQEPQGTPSMCHDIVIEDNIVYCSGLNSEVLLDISELTDEDGTPRGEPLDCGEPIEGTNGTGAMVTDCSLGGPTAQGPAAHEAWEAQDSPQAAGWEYIGHYNHPGRTDAPSNSNLRVPADEGVAVSHESRPFPVETTGGRNFMLVSDERGGGVIPGGASCTDDNFDVYGHGGLHVFDYSDPTNIQHAKMLDENGEEQQAFWRTENIFPHGTFCVVHRFRFLEGEQRIVMGYYTQGVRILDYEVDEDGYISFEEVGSYAFKESNTWTGDVFHHEDNEDGTRTYYIAVTDTLGSPSRGMDILTWTHEPNFIAGQPDPLPPVGGEDDPVRRLSGPDRIDTAIAVSQEMFDDGDADTVVVSRRQEYPDALAGGPLAAALNGPILITQDHELTERVADEIERLDPREIIILGGTNAVHQEVQDDLEERFTTATVRRIGGRDRFVTAAMIADELDSDSGRAFITEGRNPDDGRGWPDAVSVSALAAFAGDPILLVEHERLPAATAEALEEHGVTETVIVGGESAVSRSVEDELESRGHNPDREGGRDRYETSIKITERGLDEGMTTSTVWVATGLNWPDALTAGPAAGTRGEALVLIHGQRTDGSPATWDFLERNAEEIDEAILLGGTVAISEEVEQRIRETIDTDDGNGGGLPLPLPGDEAEAARTAGIPDGNTALLLLTLAVLPTAALIGRRRRRTVV